MLAQTLAELRERCPRAWAAWTRDVRERHGQRVSPLVGRVVGQRTAAAFEQAEQTGDMLPLLAYLRHVESQLLAGRDEKRLALVNSLYPRGVTLDAIMASSKAA